MTQPQIEQADTVKKPEIVKKKAKLPWLKLFLLGILIGAIGVGVFVWWVMRPIQPVELSAKEQAAVEEKLEVLESPRYVKGAKEIILTQREINGLIHKNTQLGDSLRLEFAKDAVHARIETNLDPDIPVVGGKRLKLKARFFVTHAQGRSELVLDDVTLWGVSLPNDWLGGLKGKNLLEDALGSQNAQISGVEQFRVEPGRLLIQLAE